MKKNLLPLLLLAVAAIQPASAVTFNIGLDQVTLSNSITAVSTNTLALLVVQNGSSSFTNISAGASAVLNTYLSGSAGNGNYIAWKGDFNANGIDGLFYDSPSFTIDGSNVTNNATLAFYWFPTLTFSAVNIPAGTSYGYYTSTNSTQFGSTSAWNVGANNSSSYNINAFTTNNTGNFTNNPLVGGLPNSALAAVYTVMVPEPSAFYLVGIGAVAFLIMRYRRRTKA